MKPGIHPEYKPTRITCACGRVSETYATVDELHVEICSHCHPFFTGRQKLVDTAGRVERFRRKYGKGEGPGEVAEDVAAGDDSVETESSGEETPTPEAAVATAVEEPADQPAEEAEEPNE